MSSYSDLVSAKEQLDLSDANADDAADIAMLTAIDAEISRTLELKTGRVWGGTATPAARTVDGPIGTPAAILLLPAPVRSVSSVAIVGDNPETLSSTDWILWNTTFAGDALAIRRVQGGLWPARDGVNRITVTAVWSDQASGVAAPAEIVSAATFVTVETFRQRKTSPTGEIGPEGFTIRPRNPWNFETVKEAIARHVAKPVVAF